MSKAYILGIDPGPTNTGVGILSITGEFHSSFFISPKEFGSIYSFIQELAKRLDGLNIVAFNIERFVSYEGKYSSATEEILMLIGAMVYYFSERGVKVTQFRAIEWKPKLCKWLVRNKGFSNPSTSFDKKYSLAAASAIIGQRPTTDHEADALCLAFLGVPQNGKS